MNDFDFTVKPTRRPREYRDYGPRSSRLVFILLALFFGFLGVHNFYAGKTGRGFVQLLMSFTVIGLVVCYPWVLLELAFVKKDGRGRWLE